MIDAVCWPAAVGDVLTEVLRTLAYGLLGYVLEQVVSGDGRDRLMEAAWYCVCFSFDYDN